MADGDVRLRIGGARSFRGRSRGDGPEKARATSRSGARSSGRLRHNRPLPQTPQRLQPESARIHRPMPASAAAPPLALLEGRSAPEGSSAVEVSPGRRRRLRRAVAWRACGGMRRCSIYKGIGDLHRCHARLQHPPTSTRQRILQSKSTHRFSPS